MDLTSIAFQYWVEFFFGVIAAMLVAGYQRLSKRIMDTRDEQESIHNGIRALLRDRIIGLYNHYNEKGYCPIYALDSALTMYQEYQALGGNGAIAKLVEDLKNMPKSPEDVSKNTKKVWT